MKWCVWTSMGRSRFLRCRRMEWWRSRRFRLPHSTRRWCTGGRFIPFTWWEVNLWVWNLTGTRITGTVNSRERRRRSTIICLHRFPHSSRRIFPVMRRNWAKTRRNYWKRTGRIWRKKDCQRILLPWKGSVCVTRRMVRGILTGWITVGWLGTRLLNRGRRITRPCGSWQKNARIWSGWRHITIMYVGRLLL